MSEKEKKDRINNGEEATRKHLQWMKEKEISPRSAEIAFHSLVGSFTERLLPVTNRLQNEFNELKRRFDNTITAEEMKDYLHAVWNALLGKEKYTIKTDKKRIHKIAYYAVLWNRRNDGFPIESVTSKDFSKAKEKLAKGGMTDVSDEEIATLYHELMDYWFFVQDIRLQGLIKDPK